MTLLRLENICIGFPGTEVVSNISFELAAGQTLALVGESGSGKSVTAMSILRLMDSPPLEYLGGQVFWEDQDIWQCSDRDLRRIRGNDVGVIFQEPMSSLNPLHRVGRQITEVIQLHEPLSRSEQQERALEWMKRVGIRNPEQKINAYPHELSGGERQRVMIAMALVNRPRLLIADEPTTALDVTVQKQILDLLHQLQQEMDLAVLFITHDLSVVRHIADHVVVMEKGRVVEQGPVSRIFSAPEEAYTRQLLAATPARSLNTVSSETPLLTADQLKVWFPVKKGVFQRTSGYVKAVDGISLAVRPGETLGIVGESGSGKTTLARALLQLIRSEGPVSFDGERIDGLDRGDLRDLRRQMQVVFQDPYGSLSPRMTVAEIISEGLEIHRLGSAGERDTAVVRVMSEVGLDPSLRHRYPNEFSGGQRQRIAIARVVIMQPRLVLLDEPTSALDRTVQVQVLDLLQRLQREHNLAYLFISHDLEVVRSLSHRVIVMQQGRVVEAGDCEQIFEHPEQDYTRRLIRSALALRE